MSLERTPDWLMELGRKSATVYAFVKLSQQVGFSSHLTEQLIKVLTNENEQLRRKLLEHETKAPPRWPF
jgi:hypothetical protein